MPSAAPLMTFLPLGPVTSNSFPKAQEPSTAGDLEHKRRSSSVSSAGKSTQRVLKVNPVHNGQHIGEHQDDWHEVVAVE